MAQNAESAALADELENESSAPLLAGKSSYQTFPVDTFTPAVIISYQVANVPVSPKFKKKGGPDVTPSVRFLFASHLRDKDGSPVYREDEVDGKKVVSPVILRKWTKWKSISYGDNSGLRKIFRSIPNLERLMTSDGTRREKNGKLLGRDAELWKTQFQIFVEYTDEKKKYSDVTKVKIDDTKMTDETDIDYSVEFVPYRTAKAFGNEVYLQSAVCKLSDHIHVYTQDEMIDEPKRDDK